MCVPLSPQQQNVSLKFSPTSNPYYHRKEVSDNKCKNRSPVDDDDKEAIHRYDCLVFYYQNSKETDVHSLDYQIRLPVCDT